MDDYGYPGLLRQVDVRISGRFAGNISGSIAAVIVPILGIWTNDGKDAAGIRAVLESKGWIVEQISDESGWTGDYIYRIVATVGTNYTDRQIQDQLARDLAGLFSVTGTTLLSQPWAGTGVIDIGTFDGGTVYGNTGGGSPGVNYGSTPPAINPATPTAGSDVLGSFATGLGISTPILLLGGLAVVLLATRR